MKQSNQPKASTRTSFSDWVSSFTWREIRNAIFGTLLVFVGVITAFLTMYASRTGDSRLTSAAAVASLVIVLLLLVFVVPPLARSAGAEISQIDSSIQVTTGGLIFVCIIIIVGVAAWNTGNNLLFLVLSVMIAALFVSLLAAQASLRDLVVSARFPDHIFAGEPAPVVVTIQNKKRLPSFSITVEARGPKDAEELEKQSWFYRVRFKKRALAYYTYIPRRAGAEQKAEQNFPERGHELITGFELSTKFPFGFFRHRRRLSTRKVDIIIFPKTETISDQLHLLPMNAGRLTSLRRGAGHDLHSLRDYHPQDDLRHIDWKATARVRRLIVREFTSEDERRVNVWLDTNLFEENDEETKQAFSENPFKSLIEKLLGRKIADEERDKPKQAKEKETEVLESCFERGVTQAASLVQHFIDERAEVRLILGREAGRYGVGKEHFYGCLKRLALVKPDYHEEEKEKTKDSMWQDADIALADGSFSILLTTAKPGTIPAHIWRTSHVIYL